MSKVVTIGECLIDLIPFMAGDARYTAKAGGAPTNVCACVAKLGGDAFYMGKLSEDGFSELILRKLIESGVNTEFTVRDEKHPTAMALVSLTASGDRSFSFYRKDTADLMFSENDVPQEFAEKGDVLHFCSAGLVDSPLKKAHVRAIELARKAGALVSFDVNVRLSLYESEEICKETLEAFLPYADIVKVTDDELFFITNESDERTGVAKLFEKACSAAVIFVTKGADGAAVYDRKLKCIAVPAPDVKVVDTTGAGDCFIGSILFNVTRNGFFADAEKYSDYLNFASAASGLVCASQGAIESMPTYAEVMDSLC